MPSSSHVGKLIPVSVKWEFGSGLRYPCLTTVKSPDISRSRHGLFSHSFLRYADRAATRRHADTLAFWGSVQGRQGALPCPALPLPALPFPVLPRLGPRRAAGSAQTNGARASGALRGLLRAGKREPGLCPPGETAFCFCKAAKKRQKFSCGAQIS